MADDQRAFRAVADRVDRFARELRAEQRDSVQQATGQFLGSAAEALAAQLSAGAPNGRWAFVKLLSLTIQSLSPLGPCNQLYRVACEKTSEESEAAIEAAAEALRPEMPISVPADWDPSLVSTGAGAYRHSLGVICWVITAGEPSAAKRRAAQLLFGLET